MFWDYLFVFTNLPQQRHFSLPTAAHCPYFVDFQFFQLIEKRSFQEKKPQSWSNLCRSSHLFLLSVYTTSSSWSSLPQLPHSSVQAPEFLVSLSWWLSSCEAGPCCCSCSSAQRDYILLQDHPSPPLSENQPLLWNTPELRCDSSYLPPPPHFQSSLPQTLLVPPDWTHSALLSLSTPAGNMGCSGKGEGERWRQAGGEGRHGCRCRAQALPPHLHLSVVRSSPSSSPSPWLGKPSHPVPRPLRVPGLVVKKIQSLESLLEVWGLSADAGLKSRKEFPQSLWGKSSWEPDPHPALLWSNRHILWCQQVKNKTIFFMIMSI